MSSSLFTFGIVEVCCGQKQTSQTRAFWCCQHGWHFGRLLHVLRRAHDLARLPVAVPLRQAVPRVLPKGGFCWCSIDGRSVVVSIDMYA